MTISKDMLAKYRTHVQERKALGIPPLPLSLDQTRELVELLEAPPRGEEEFLLHLLEDRVPAGVDNASRVKCEFLTQIAKGHAASARWPPRR